jgi:hypothetical protein
MARRLALFSVLLVLVAAVTSVAGERNQIIRLPPSPSVETVADCGDFEVHTTFLGTTTIHLHFDKEGNLVKEKQRWSMEGKSVYYNAENPEIAIEGGPEHLNVNIDYQDGLIKISGVNFKVTLPGVGMILHQGGHYTYDLTTGEYIHVGGPDDVWSGNFEALCAALAP